MGRFQGTFVLYVTGPSVLQLMELFLTFTWRNSLFSDSHFPYLLGCSHPWVIQAHQVVGWTQGPASNNRIRQKWREVGSEMTCLLSCSHSHRLTWVKPADVGAGLWRGLWGSGWGWPLASSWYRTKVLSPTTARNWLLLTTLISPGSESCPGWTLDDCSLWEMPRHRARRGCTWTPWPPEIVR